jgi:hypothetical protein
MASNQPERPDAEHRTIPDGAGLHIGPGVELTVGWNLTHDRPEMVFTTTTDAGED